MNASVSESAEGTATEHFDVVIAGAGIAGIGSAYHLHTQCPGKSFVVLEALESFGGTWLMHRYPGIRSDSDLYTFGYRFKPWTGVPIATAQEIRNYLGEVIEENQLGPHIRYRHRICAAVWSSAENLWHINAARADTGETLRFTANFLWMCQGYYRHSEGYTPGWNGMDRYRGRIVHPQTWPEDLDYAGKRIVVVGSGATAATIIPALAEQAAHVICLQRSPTYFIPRPNADEVAVMLRELEIDEAWIHHIVRKKILRDQALFFRRVAEEPEVVRKQLIDAVRKRLPPDFDVDRHFTPRYLPWMQRVAVAPGGDLFKVMASGRASVVTDEIDRFVEAGILLKSGAVVEADIIVTATGFNLSILGDIPFSVDGENVDFSKTVAYRGMMFTGVPNMLWVFGYFKASWTLRIDLLGDFVCRLLKHMDAKGAKRVAVALRPEDRDMPLLPWIDTGAFNPGYMQRGLALMPLRGDKPEWQHSQNYWAEKDEIPAINLDDAAFVYA